MSEIVPRRRFTRGVRPGPTTAELGKKRKYNERGEEIEVESKWNFRRKILTEREKRRILGKVVEIGTRTVFRNHIYQWGGRFYIQREGGSIGLRLTGVTAKLRMVNWMQKYKNLLDKNKVRTVMNTIYVDDMNWRGQSLELGRRWSEEEKMFIGA